MMKTMKRIAPALIFILIVAAVGAYFVYGHLESRAKEKAWQEKKARLKELTRAAINKMVSKFDAVDDWAEKLTKGKILTMELEKLWLIDRPLLFVGWIDDVANTDDPNAYSISMTYRGKLDGHLALSLRCPKALFDSFLKEHSKKALHNVAVIGKIDKIETHGRKMVEVETEKGEAEKGEIEETRVGIGHCLDITAPGNWERAVVERALYESLEEKD